MFRAPSVRPPVYLKKKKKKYKLLPDVKSENTNGPTNILCRHSKAVDNCLGLRKIRGILD